MAQNRRVNIILTAKDRTKAAFRSATKSLKSFTSELGASAKTTVALFGKSIPGAIAAAGTALAALARSSLNYADAIAKQADTVGISVENLQRLRHAASTAGVRQGQLDTAVQRFSRRVGEAAQGTGVLYKELQRLGIEITDANGNMRNTTDILLDYADALAGAGSRQEQLRLAVAAFDTEGARMVNVMRLGSEGMEKLMERAEELGLILKEETVRQSEELNQRWDDFTSKFWAKWHRAILAMSTAVGFTSDEVKTLSGVQEKYIEVLDRIARREKLVARGKGLLIGRTKEKLKADREELKTLEEKLEVLQELHDLENAPPAAPPETGQPPDLTGKTTGEQLVENRLAAQKGEITNEEYRKRRREIIRSSDPYGEVEAATAAVPAISYSTMTPEEVARAIGDSTEREINNRVFRPKVDPIMIGDAATIEWSTQDTVEKEGSNSGL